MSKKSDLAKIYFIKEKIEDLESYQSRTSGMVELLEDKLFFDAVLMCLLQIGESLNKLDNKYKLLDDKEIKGAYDVRNFIAHDYEGIHKSIIENIVRFHIPRLKETIEKTIKDEESKC